MGVATFATHSRQHHTASLHGHFPQRALEDLRSRIRATQWPEAETHASQGVSRRDLEFLTTYWADSYDWRRCELALNASPQLVTEIQGLDIHAIHVRSRHEHALPIVLTHGWPGSVLEFLDVIGPLVDPPDASDAFHVVVPSLPGYGFSGKPTRPGWDVDRIARAWVDLMARLGYDRFAAQGGDWGAMVTTAIGRNHPDHVIGIHLNMPQGKEPVGPYDLSERDKRASIVNGSVPHYRATDTCLNNERGHRRLRMAWPTHRSPCARGSLRSWWTGQTATPCPTIRSWTT